MKIYPTEIADGLQDSLTNVAIAMTCEAKPLENPTSINIEKAKAAVGAGKNFDVFYLSSILASVGSNLNDDVFLPNELWAARDTPVHKQFNYEHNEKDVIGCIFDSFLLSSEGNLITSESDIDQIKDIGTHAVIWTQWEDPELQDRMDKLIAEIENGEQFVSMEVLFKNFDYLLVDNETKEEQILARSEATAFLTKHLKGFGGDGIYKSYAVKRIPREFTFSGKGLVRNPANRRSVIDSNLFEDSNSKSRSESTELTNLTKQVAKRGTSMDVLEKQVADLTAKLEKAQAELAKTQKAYADEKENLVSAEIETLTKEVAGVVSQRDEVQRLLEAAKAEFETFKTEAEEAATQKQTEVDEAKARIAELEAEKATAARVAKLVEVGNTTESAEEICKTWASVSDEQFDDIVKLYAENKEDKGQMKNKAEEGKASDDSNDDDKEEMKEEKAKADFDFTEALEKASANVNFAASEDDKDEDFKAFADSLRSKLPFNINKGE